MAVLPYPAQIAFGITLTLTACGIAGAAGVAVADDASVRASAGILMSRSMDVKDRVHAAESLARYFPRAAVPVLIEALNETSEPVRRAAARGLWTIAQNENADDAAAARAAIPALRVALGDASVSVAVYAANALERLGEPPASLAETRRKALRTAGAVCLRALSRRARPHRGRSGTRARALCPRFPVRGSEAGRDRPTARVQGTTSASPKPRWRGWWRPAIAACCPSSNARLTPRPGTASVLRAMAAQSHRPAQFAHTLVVAVRLRPTRKRSRPPTI